jgi:hypothetical protein
MKYAIIALLLAFTVSEADAALVCVRDQYPCARVRVHRSVAVDKPTVIYIVTPAQTPPVCQNFLCAPLTIVNTVLSPMFYPRWYP